MSEKKLGSTNVVILAKSHNPTIVSKDWIIKKEVLEEPITNFVHTPPFSMVENNELNIHVDLNRMQITVKKAEPYIIDKLLIAIKNYVSSLSETPYTAIGFNFSYRVITEESVESIFSPEVGKFRKAFSEKYRIGGAIRFNFEDFIVMVSLPPDEKVLANFNFHFDIKGGSDEVMKKLKSYHATMRKAEEVLEVLFDG